MNSVLQHPTTSDNQCCITRINKDKIVPVYYTAHDSCRAVSLVGQSNRHLMITVGHKVQQKPRVTSSQCMCQQGNRLHVAPSALSQEKYVHAQLYTYIFDPDLALAQGRLGAAASCNLHQADSISSYTTKVMNCRTGCG